MIVNERAHIEDGIITAERKLEAGLAILGSMARARAAAKLRQDGIDVADEVDLGVRIVVNHFEGSGRTGREAAVIRARPLASGETCPVAERLPRLESRE